MFKKKMQESGVFHGFLIINSCSFFLLYFVHDALFTESQFPK